MLSKPFSLLQLNTQNILLPGRVSYTCGLLVEVAGEGLAGGRTLDQAVLAPEKQVEGDGSKGNPLTASSQEKNCILKNKVRQKGDGEVQGSCCAAGIGINWRTPVYMKRYFLLTHPFDEHSKNFYACEQFKISSAYDAFFQIFLFLKINCTDSQAVVDLLTQILKGGTQQCSLCHAQVLYG